MVRFFFGLRVLFEYIGIVTDHMADGICQFSLGRTTLLFFFNVPEVCCGGYEDEQKSQGIFTPVFRGTKMACILLMILLTISQLRLLADKIQP